MTYCNHMQAEAVSDPWSIAQRHLAEYLRTRTHRSLEEALMTCADLVGAQAQRALGDHQDAMDATQEALVQIVRAVERYDSSRPLAPWVGAIVHRACARLRRSQRRRRHHERKAPLPMTLHDEQSEILDGDLIRESVARLGHDDQAIIHLHYFAGLSQTDIAQSLDLTPNAVAVRLHRARERLRRILARRGVCASTASVAIALQLPDPVASAQTTTLASKVAAWHAAGQLPATTIPLGPWSQVALAVHQSATAATWLVAAGLVAGAGLIALAVDFPSTPAATAAVAAEVPPPPPPPAPPHPWWDEDARRDLANLDPGATLLGAIDFAAMRRLAPTLKPTSLLADQDPAAIRWHQTVAQHVGAWLGDPAQRLLVKQPQEWERGLISVHDLVASPAHLRPTPRERTLLVVRTTAAGDRLVASTMTPSNVAQAPAASGAFRLAEGQPWWTGVGDGLALFGGSDPVQARSAGKIPPYQPAAADLQAPAWMRFDAGRLIAQYAAGPTVHDLEHFFSPGWEKRRPTVWVQLAPDQGTWSDTGVIADLGMSPITLAWSFATTRRALPGAPRLSHPDGRLAGLIPDRTLAKLAVGLNFPADPAPANAWTTALNGELFAWLEPGAPLPSFTLVAPLRPAGDGAAAFRVVVDMLQAELTPPPPGALEAAEVRFSLVKLTIIRAIDRLTITNGDPAATLANPPPQTLEHDAEIMVDLPTLYPALAPFLGLWLPPRFNELLPPPAVMARHAAPWHLTLDQGPDDLHFQERGLPVFGTLVVTACAGVTGFAHPNAEIAYEKAYRSVTPAQRQALHRLRRTLGFNLTKEDGAFSINFKLTGRRDPPRQEESAASWLVASGVERSVVTPLVGDDTSDDALNRSGRWWPQWPGDETDCYLLPDDETDDLKWIAEIRHLPISLKSIPEVSAWLIPLAGNPGWHIGLVSGCPVLVCSPLPGDGHHPATPPPNF